MKPSILSPTSLAAVACLAFASTSTHAVEIFSATTANIAPIANAPAGGEMLPTITGATPNLIVTQAAQNNNMAGFTSASDINTLNGTALTVADTVTFSITVDSLTGANLRSNGVEFGLSDAATFRPASGNLLLGMTGSNSGSDVRIIATSFQDVASLDFNSNQAALEDGFTITLTANAAGYRFVLSDILVAGSTNPMYTDGDTTATISGTFAGNEFLDHFGTGFFYTAVQQQTGTAKGDNMVTDYSVATIDVTIDTDEDGMPDEYEDATPGHNKNFAGDASQGANDGLFDNDGRTNLEEYQDGTDPNVADVDMDDLNDGEEFAAGTNPFIADTDHDKLSDGAEVKIHFTDPRSGDSDGDFFKDFIEIEGGSLPNDIASTPTFPSISWSAQVFDEESDLSTNGTLLFADNFQGADLTLNGIPFIGQMSPSGVADFSSPNLQTLLNSTSTGINLAGFYDDEVPALAPLVTTFWLVGDPDPINLGITGLTPGKNYLVQLGRVDDRSGGIINRYMKADSFGGGAELDPIGSTNLTYGGPDNPAILVTGTFTATSTVQSFVWGQYLDDDTLVGSHIPFIQVREIGVDVTVTAVRHTGTTAEVDFANLDPGQSYQLVRSADLADGFPTIVDGPRLPAGATDTFTDSTPLPNNAFYLLEEAP